MKKLGIALVLAATLLTAGAQEKKPLKGAFGIGFGTNIYPFQQSVNFTGYLTDNVEFGGSVWMGFNRSRNSTYDSLFILGVNSDFIAERDHRTINTSFSFGIAPLVRYHFKTKNNLDVYTGGIVPIGISTNRQVNSIIVDGTDYNQTNKIVTRSPITVNVGAGVLLGCRFFFYKNLAFGAETGLGVMAGITNGKNRVTTSVSNSGGNNASSNVNIDDVTVEEHIGNDSQDFTMMRNITLHLVWYFGGRTE